MVGLRAWTLQLLAASLLCIGADSIRKIISPHQRSAASETEAGVQGVDAASLSHAQGLEAEHYFDGGQTAWPLDKEGHDETRIRQVLAKVNEGKEQDDVEWEWQNHGAHWTFGLVMATNRTPEGSLVQHMLHRHGLAPLLASRQKDFEAYLETTYLRRINATTSFERLQAFVEAEENYTGVAEISALLGGMTLGGLRNLHSWDHQWSVYKGQDIEGCTYQTAGTCVLQAGFSRPAADFMFRHGFTPEGIEVAKSYSNWGYFWEGVNILNPFANGTGVSFLKNYLLKPGQTSSTGIKEYKLEPSLLGKSSVSGMVEWEGGGSSDFSIKLESGDFAKLQDLSHKDEQKQAVYDLVEKWMAEQVAKHRNNAQTKETSARFWVAEEAEFAEMHARLP